MTIAAFFCCVTIVAVFTACTEDDNAVSTGSADIVGNWCADVSGLTYAKWNYGETWQNTEFKADGTGSTRIYYTLNGKAVAGEEIDFTYTAANDGSLTMVPTDRDEMNGTWSIVNGQLKINNGADINLTLKKTTDDMAAKFDKWSQEKIFDVPRPAKFTVFVYGNAGGAMDDIIEGGLWERVRDFLKDDGNVRVVCMYKYGEDKVDDKGNHSFQGKYAQPGDNVWFLLNNETDLNDIKNHGLQALGYGQEAIELKLCDPNTMRLFLEFSSLYCPAKEYVLAIWGHGSGFDAMNDIPGKYQVNSPTRGVMTDEWADGEWMDMYEMYDAMKAAGIDHFNTVMFHNCFMGNIESLVQAGKLADYLLASAHVLDSDGLLMTEFIRGLMETGDSEQAGKLMFDRAGEDWSKGYSYEAQGSYENGDYKMMRTDKFEPLVTACKALTDRLLELYPSQKEAIDKATSQVYRFQPIRASGQTKLEWEYPFFDLANYAQLLAKETGDAQLKNISADIDEAFEHAIIHYRDVNNSKQHLDHYTLSICLLRHAAYTFDYLNKLPQWPAINNYNEGYEKCDFHKLTGWGNWLNTNTQALDNNPQKGGGGKLE